MRRLAALLAGCLLVLGACSGGGASPSASTAAIAPTPSPQAVALTIYGAASLKGALDRAKSAYETAHPGTTLTISTDSSTTLETQIEQGAPVDVFLSADQTNPKKLIDESVADGDAVPFAGNKLTVIVPTDNPGHIVAATDVGRPGVKVIAAGDKVPITKYTTQLVANLSKGASDPAAFVAEYTKNIVSKEDNVAAVVSKIELGEGDVAIVYVTDAKASTTVATIDVPTDANVPATYDGVVIKASKNPAASKAFLDWFAGPDGQAILGGLGFLPPS